jgi:hypothetical protein
LAETVRSTERDIRRIEAAFAESSDAGGARAPAWPKRGRALVWLVVAAAVVAIAFAGIGVVLLWKTAG